MGIVAPGKCVRGAPACTATQRHTLGGAHGRARCKISRACCSQGLPVSRVDAPAAAWPCVRNRHHVGGFACEVLYRIEYDCNGGSLLGAVGLRFFRRMKRRSGSSPATASDGVIVFLLFQNAPGYSGGACRLSSAPSEAVDGDRLSFPNGLLPGGNAGNAQFGTASLEQCAAVAAADGPMAGNDVVFCKPSDNCARAAHRSQMRRSVED